MTKYKEYYEKMVSENKDIFGKFTKIHFEYSIDQNQNQERQAHHGQGENFSRLRFG